MTFYGNNYASAISSYKETHMSVNVPSVESLDFEVQSLPIVWLRLRFL